MQAKPTNTIRLKDAHQPDYFGLGDLEVYPLTNVSRIIIQKKPSKNSTFISLVIQSMKKVAMFVFVFGFLMLFQDFMFHYFEHKHESNFSHHAVPFDETPLIIKDNIPNIAVLDSFVAEFEEPVIEEEKNSEIPNSISNHTDSQPIVDTNIDEVSNSDSAYYIIVGTFKQEANADRLSYSLMLKGIEANIITSAHISRVSVAQFQNRHKAEEKLNRYKSFDENVWIYAVSK